MRGELFPKEVTGKAPKMTLTGDEMLYVEQHRGLVGYQPEEICFRTACGMLKVTGERLRFRRYTADEAVVTGSIRNVGIQPEGGRR